MKQPLFLKNTPIDEKRISFIEKVLSRLTRRQVKTSKAIITPYPISNAIFSDKVDGAILRYLFPCKGKITKVVVDLGKKPKQEININIHLSNELDGKGNDFSILKRNFNTDLDINVDEFSKLSVNINYENNKDEDNITECWIALLWVPDIKDTKIKQFLLDELLENVSEEKY